MTPLTKALQHNSVDIPPFVAYLERHGWQPAEVYNERILMFQKGTYDDDTPIQIVLPSSNRYADCARVLAGAITFLADLEDKSTEAIFNEIYGFQSKPQPLSILKRLPQSQVSRRERRANQRRRSSKSPREVAEQQRQHELAKQRQQEADRKAKAEAEQQRLAQEAKRPLKNKDNEI